ncbi:hypothetical protein ADUPG1_009317 [Aduncisulcus paluster]|uniref:Uncharacterized protein n=1 Tax=Aduncisulcus paluster TaxID=2918883 RepID=A0ABQ5KV55_9EUKA|nr:hypothetical protein ADUPG1_009317 [Aduncisulcus paluster]
MMCKISLPSKNGFSNFLISDPLNAKGLAETIIFSPCFVQEPSFGGSRDKRREADKKGDFEEEEEEEESEEENFQSKGCVDFEIARIHAMYGEEDVSEEVRDMMQSDGSKSARFTSLTFPFSHYCDVPEVSFKYQTTHKHGIHSFLVTFLSDESIVQQKRMKIHAGKPLALSDFDVISDCPKINSILITHSSHSPVSLPSFDLGTNSFSEDDGFHEFLGQRLLPVFFRVKVFARGPRYPLPSTVSHRPLPLVGPRIMETPCIIQEEGEKERKKTEYDNIQLGFDPYEASSSSYSENPNISSTNPSTSLKPISAISALYEDQHEKSMTLLHENKIVLDKIFESLQRMKKKLSK